MQPSLFPDLPDMLAPAPSAHPLRKRRQVAQRPPALLPDLRFHLSPDLLARLRANRWVDPIRKCWCWTGSTDGRGYAMMSVAGRHNARMSRVVYQHWHGPIPPGLYVMHSCDNPTCINPDHLSVGSALDNSADASRKGRKSIKLSRAQVAELVSSPLTQRALAERFGVTYSTVGKHRRRYRRIGADLF